MGGLARICKLYGRIQVQGVTHVWDYANDCAVLESEMPFGSKRHKASERAKYKALRTATTDENATYGGRG